MLVYHPFIPSPTPGPRRSLRTSPHLGMALLVCARANPPSRYSISSPTLTGRSSACAGLWRFVPPGSCSRTQRSTAAWRSGAARARGGTVRTAVTGTSAAPTAPAQGTEPAQRRRRRQRGQPPPPACRASRGAARPMAQRFV